MQDRKTAARGPGLLVRRQHFAARLAAVGLAEIAERGGGLQSALGHQARCHGEVAIRRHVPVVRKLEFLAVLYRTAEAWGQETGLAAIIEGEGNRRQVKYLLAEKKQLGVLGLAQVASVVELQLADLHEPVILARTTGSIGCVGGAVTVRAEKLDTAGVAARAIVCQQIFGGEKIAGSRIELQLEFGAGEKITATHDSHVAAGVEFVTDLHIVNDVGLDDRILLAQFGVALDMGEPPRFPGYPHSLNEYRQFADGFTRRLQFPFQLQCERLRLRRERRRHRVGSVLCEGAWRGGKHRSDCHEPVSPGTKVRHALRRCNAPCRRRRMNPIKFNQL